MELEAIFLPSNNNKNQPGKDRDVFRAVFRVHFCPAVGFGSAVAVYEPIRGLPLTFLLHVCPVNTSDLLPLLVYNHRAFSPGALHHRGKGCHGRLRECVFMSRRSDAFTVALQLCLLQFRHRSDNQVNNRQSQVLIRGS